MTFNNKFLLLLWLCICLLLVWPSWAVSSQATGLYQTDTPDNNCPLATEYHDTLTAAVKTDAPPFGFLDNQGNSIGFEIDLVRAIAARCFGSAGAIEFVPVTSEDRIRRLINGEVDIVAATMTYTEDRDELIDFSQTYYEDGQNILVRADTILDREDDTTRIQRLDGQRIAAVAGSTSLTKLKTWAVSMEITVTVVIYEKYTEAVKPLLTGDIDALTTDRGILLGIRDQYSDDLTILLEDNLSQEPYGFGLPPNQPEYQAWVNETLQNMAQDGTYESIYKEWFPDSEPFSIEMDPHASSGPAHDLVRPVIDEINKIVVDFADQIVINPILPSTITTPRSLTVTPSLTVTNEVTPLPVSSTPNTLPQSGGILVLPER